MFHSDFFFFMVCTSCKYSCLLYEALWNDFSFSPCTYSQTTSFHCGSCLYPKPNGSVSIVWNGCAHVTSPHSLNNRLFCHWTTYDKIYRLDQKSCCRTVTYKNIDPPNHMLLTQNWFINQRNFIFIKGTLVDFETKLLFFLSKRPNVSDLPL